MIAKGSTTTLYGKMLKHSRDTAGAKDMSSLKLEPTDSKGDLHAGSPQQSK